MKKGFLLLALCLCVMPVAMSQNLFLVTEQRQLEIEGTKNVGNYLRSLGYKVTVDEGGGTAISAYQGKLTAEKIAHLESFDVVIVLRATSSGNFSGAGINEQWSQLKVPVLLGTAYLVRKERWFWIDGTQERTVAEGVDIAIPNHPIVAGLTGVFFDTPLGIDHVTAGDVGDGKIVATLVDANGDNAPAIVAWGPTDKFPAGGNQIHTFPRVFMPFYRYHETTENATGSYATDPADGDFPNYTPNGLKIIDQAIKYLLSFKTNVQNWDCY